MFRRLRESKFFEVELGSKLSSQDFHINALLKIWEILRHSMHDENTRVRSYRRCSVLQPFAFLLSNIGFCFLSRSWREDSDFVLVCAYCHLLIFLAAEDIPEIEFIENYHHLKREKCPIFTKDVEWQMCEVPYYRHLNYLDVKFTDFCHKDIESGLWNKSPDKLTRRERINTDHAAVCQQCKERLVNVVLLPCRDCYLCNLCAIGLEQCKHCHESVQAQCLLVLA
jgi:hypothetical protein